MRVASATHTITPVHILSSDVYVICSPFLKSLNGARGPYRSSNCSSNPVMMVTRFLLCVSYRSGQKCALPVKGIDTHRTRLSILAAPCSELQRDNAVR